MLIVNILLIVKLEFVCNDSCPLFTLRSSLVYYFSNNTSLKFCNACFLSLSLMRNEML